MSSTKFPTLYSRNKDKSIQEWTIETKGSQIVTTFGKVGGQMQVAVKVAKAKSIGQSNETTPEEQAKLDARSMWKKKKDKGYFESVKEAQEEIVFLPMLAYELKDMKKLKFPVFVQPKMDGVRCLARWHGDHIQLLSRGGKPYSVEHIAKRLESILLPGTVFDGELYIHNVLRQDIQALVKKPRDEMYGDTGYTSSDLEYWVYDCFSIDALSRPFSDRLEDLKNVLQYKDSTIRRVITQRSTDVDDLIARHKMYVANGFEGTIIRLPDGPYELANRSRSLLKHKDFQDAEFEIVGFGEGVGKFEGCVIWKCKTDSDGIFDVVPKGTLQQKKKWFLEAKKHIGEKLTVKFQDLSSSGIPSFPVGIGFRLPEDTDEQED